MSAVVKVLDAQSVPWQVGSFGRIDKAGGGTLAKYIARLGADIIDIGPALLSMHSLVTLTWLKRSSDRQIPRYTWKAGNWSS